jgi:hypothetical protein
MDGTNALAAAIDADHVEHVRLMLEAGGSQPRRAGRARGPSRLRAGDDSTARRAGADLDRAGGETWRGDVPLSTPYQHAVLRGRDDLAQTLAELGASTQVSDADRGVADLASGERPDPALPNRLDVDAQEVVILAALRGHLDIVADALGPDFRGGGGRVAGVAAHGARGLGWKPDHCAPASRARR